MLSRLREFGLARTIAVLLLGFVVAGGVAAWVLLATLPVGAVSVNVRWKPDISATQRADLERQLHLTEGYPTEGTTVAYVLTDSSIESIRALVTHPNVDDTAHIDRNRFLPEAYDTTRRVVAFVIIAGVGAVAADLYVRTNPVIASGRLDILRLIVAICVFIFTWFFRFNDPNGGFAGLTDDHFFYLVRGWQLLLGELPVRDFVDHGAPLYYYVAAGVQLLFGRGTLSDLAFSVTMIAFGGALTFWLAARASGWILAGALGGAFHVLLMPRFYNYPKILVYAVAIPLLWWYIDRPGRRPLVWLAVITVVAFLFRHDHGVFVALATAAMLLFLVDIPWRERARHALVYGALVIALAAPYLVFIQINGGVVPYFQQAAEWAANERSRTPVQWPGLFDNPAGVSRLAQEGAPIIRGVGTVRDNRVAWVYYLELAVPILVLAVLAASRDGFFPDWPRAVPKMGVVAVLGLLLNAGFLRSPLVARLADPSVPHAILLAWLVVALPRTLIFRASWRDALQGWLGPLRAAVVAVSMLLLFVLGSVLTIRLNDRLDDAYLVNGAGEAVGRVQAISGALRDQWNPSTWAGRPGQSQLMDLAHYLNACTRPTGRVFVQSYIPQVLGLAQRGFAAGHADLRPGFFETDEAQALALTRLRNQDVPVVLLATGASLANFRESFPGLTAYFDTQYHVAGTHTFDDRHGITLLVNNDARETGRFPPLDWPCLR